MLKAKKRFTPSVSVDFEMNEDFAQLLAATSTANQVKEGTVVKGKIVAIEKDLAVVDVGLKNEGRIPLSEFALALDLPKPQVGDRVDVYVEKVENRRGETVLSREKAIREESWRVLEDAYNNAENVDGVIFGRVKGGFTVDLSGVVAFLPGSQVDVRPIKDVAPIMNIVQPFQILKMDRKLGNIVVSRRAILEESRSEARDQMLSQIAEGSVLEGMVKNITDYGAFIDLGSIDGLLHVTDISWSRINHPSEVLSIGQTVKVVVTKFNEETKRISLGMKQLEENPWKGIEADLPIGQKMTGKISNISDYGAFIELKPGIEGLVHTSEISWTKANMHPRQLLQIGQEVEFIILEVDQDKHRISLSIKQTQPNPWQKFASNHKVGDVIKGRVRNVADFGVFVALDEEIDGLIHASDLSWDSNGDELIKEYKKDQEVECKILDIDVEKEKIALGVKQLGEDPIAGGLEGISKGETVTVVVSEVKSDGINVRLNDTLTVFIKRSELSSEKVDQRPDRFAVGDRVEVKVTQFEPKTRKVSLSVKALEVDNRTKVIKEYGSADSGATLGDILGAALNQGKEGK